MITIENLNKFLLNLDTKYSVYFENGLIGSIVYCFFMTIVAFVFYKVVKFIINKKDSANRASIVSMWKIFVIAILVYSCLTQFKPVQSLTSTLIASGGIIALVISLAAQESISNLFAGLMIIFTQPFKEGDLIKINNGEYIGYVEKITLRHTIIKSYEHNRITIPNSKMNQASIENANLIDTKKLNFLEISIGYDSDIDKAMDIIKEEASKHKYCYDARTKTEKKNKVSKVPIHITMFEESGIRLRASIYSKDSKTGFQMLSDLRYSIKKRFDEEGIEIPYTYRTVVIKNNTNN